MPNLDKICEYRVLYWAIALWASLVCVADLEIDGMGGVCLQTPLSRTRLIPPP